MLRPHEGVACLSKYRDTWATEYSISSGAAALSARVACVLRQTSCQISCAANRTSGRIGRPASSISLSHHVGAFIDTDMSHARDGSNQSNRVLSLAPATFRKPLDVGTLDGKPDRIETEEAQLRGSWRRSDARYRTAPDLRVNGAEVKITVADLRRSISSSFSRPITAFLFSGLHVEVILISGSEQNAPMKCIHFELACDCLAVILTAPSMTERWRV
jgi:hypothetical protein